MSVTATLLTGFLSECGSDDPVIQSVVTQFLLQNRVALIRSKTALGRLPPKGKCLYLLGTAIALEIPNLASHPPGVIGMILNGLM
jgi:hypothetical protein